MIPCAISARVEQSETRRVVMTPVVARDTRCDCSPGDVGADHPGYQGGWQRRIPWQEYIFPPGGQREGDPRYTNRAPETAGVGVTPSPQAADRQPRTAHVPLDKDGYVDLRDIAHVQLTEELNWRVRPMPCPACGLYAPRWRCGCKKDRKTTRTAADVGAAVAQVSARMRPRHAWCRPTAPPEEWTKSLRRWRDRCLQAHARQVQNSRLPTGQAVAVEGRVDTPRGCEVTAGGGAGAAVGGARGASREKQEGHTVVAAGGAGEAGGADASRGRLPRSTSMPSAGVETTEAAAHSEPWETLWQALYHGSGGGRPLHAAGKFWDPDMPTLTGWRTTALRTRRRAKFQVAAIIRAGSLADFVPELTDRRLRAMGMVDANSARQGLNPTWRVVPGGAPVEGADHWRVPWSAVAEAAQACDGEHSEDDGVEVEARPYGNDAVAMAAVFDALEGGAAALADQAPAAPRGPAGGLDGLALDMAHAWTCEHCLDRVVCRTPLLGAFMICQPTCPSFWFIAASVVGHKLWMRPLEMPPPVKTNYGSIRRLRGAAQDAWHEMVANDWVRQVPRTTLRHVTAQGAVKKSHGRARLVQDGSEWPGGQPRFRMIRPVHFFARVRPGAAVAVVDVWRAFPSIPVHPSIWQDLGLVWGGTFFHLRVLPTGGRASPIILQATMAEFLRVVREICALQSEGGGFEVETAVYMDDAVLQAAASTRTAAALLRTYDVAKWLGLRLTKVQFSTSVEWLGVVLDTQAMTVRLKDATKNKVLRGLHEYVAGPVARRTVESLAGLLQYVAQFMPAAAQLRVRPFYWHLRAWRHVRPQAQLPPSRRARTAAGWWERMFARGVPPLKLRWDWRRAAVLVADTSGLPCQGIGAWIWLPCAGRVVVGMARRRHARGELDLAVGGTVKMELDGALWGWRLWRSALVAARTRSLIVVTDNYGAAAAITRGSSGSAPVCNTLREFLDATNSAGIRVAALWLRRSHPAIRTADALGRWPCMVAECVCENR